MGTTATKTDISKTVGGLITAEAATWKGTPYQLVGQNSQKGIGGDCSGTTYLIYSAACCPYGYNPTETFVAYASKSGLFRSLGSDEIMQEGDILYWSGHMAIYSSFVSDKEDATTPRTNDAGQSWTQINDMWTATHPATATRPVGGPYQPAQMKYFKPGSKPTVFRYQK